MNDRKNISERKTAVIVGIMFIVATVASLAGSAFYDPIISKSDWLLKISSQANQIKIGSLLEFIAALSSVSIAIWLYPVIKKYNHGLALSAVIFRTIEAIFYTISAVGLVALLSLAQEYTKAGGQGLAYYQAIGGFTLAVRDVIGFVFAVCAFAIGALCYYFIFFQTKLIPRWISVWGILGCVSLLGVVLVTLFNGPPFSMTGTVVIFAMPIAIQEMVLAIWLLVKGFGIPEE